MVMLFQKIILCDPLHHDFHICPNLINGAARRLPFKVPLLSHYSHHKIQDVASNIAITD